MSENSFKIGHFMRVHVLPWLLVALVVWYLYWGQDYDLPREEIDANECAIVDGLFAANSSIYGVYEGMHNTLGDMIGSGVFVGKTINSRKHVLFLTARHVAIAMFIMQIKSCQIAFSRWGSYTKIKRLTVPKARWILNDPQHDLAVFDITDGLEEIKDQGTTLKYIDLDGDNDPMAVRGIAIAQSSVYDYLMLREGAEVFALCSDPLKMEITNPHSYTWKSPMEVMRGETRGMYSWHGLDLLQASFGVVPGNSGSPAFAYGTEDGKRRLYFLGLVVVSNAGKSAGIMPIDYIYKALKDARFD